MLSEYDAFYNAIEEKFGKVANEIWDVHTLSTWLNGLVAPRDVERNEDRQRRPPRERFCKSVA